MSQFLHGKISKSGYLKNHSFPLRSESVQRTMDYHQKHEFDFETENEEDEEEMDSEAVMKEIQRLYNTKEIGIREALKYLGVSSTSVSTTPRQKITVLLVGSHNAAKEKFLNLYFNDTRQDEFMSKVNYEKLDKIYITQGMRRKFLTGATVLDYCPHLAQLGNIPGLKDYLTTEITTHKTKSLVSFVLAPESTDTYDYDDATIIFDENKNHVKYPFKIERAMKSLAEAADLIFIFFDPSGNTPPSQTLKPFEDLWENYYGKIHLILAKANERECTDEAREATLSKIVHQVWRHPQVQRVGSVPQIFCPDLTDGIRDEEQLWNIIQKTADKSIERSLRQLEKDATYIGNQLTIRLNNNTKAKEEDSTPSPTAILAFFCFALIASICVMEISDIYCKALLIPQSRRLQMVCDEIKANKSLCFSFFLALAYFLFRPIFQHHDPILTKEEEELLKRRIRFAHHALYRKEEMEKQYFNPSEFEQ